ncbi:unnamed protein product [Prunus armeniaca]
MQKQLEALDQSSKHKQRDLDTSYAQTKSVIFGSSSDEPQEVVHENPREEIQRTKLKAPIVESGSTTMIIFDYKEVPNEKKVNIVAIKLRRNASAWWEQLKTRRDSTGKSKIKTWEKMKKELKRIFFPENYIQANFLKLHNLR